MARSIFLGLFLLICNTALASQPVEMQHGLITLSDRTELPLRIWSTPAPKMVVLGIHGFNDYGKAFDALAKSLVAQRQAVVYAYDQRGFGANPDRGTWPGSEQLLSDIREVAQQLRRDHPNLMLVVVGESMGGALVLRASTEAPGLAADRIILKAPAIWGAETMPWYQRASLHGLNAIAPNLTFTGRGLRRLGIAPTDDPAVASALSRDPLVIKETKVSSLYGITELMGQALHHPIRFPTPLLVLYGLNDKVIPPEPTCYWLRKLHRDNAKVPARVDFLIYPEGWHMLTRQLKASAVIEDIVRWLDSDASRTVNPSLLKVNEARQRVCERH